MHTFNQLLLLTLLVNVLAINQITETFKINKGAIYDTGDYQTYYYPSYSLGRLSAGCTINIKISLPSMFLQDLSLLQVKLLKITKNPNSLTYPALTTISSSPTFRQYSYDVTSQVASSLFSLNFFSFSYQDFDFFYIQVSSYNTSQPRLKSNYQTLLKVTEFQRTFITKLIYVSNSQTLSFRFTPATSSLDQLVFHLIKVGRGEPPRSNGYVSDGPITCAKSYNNAIKTVTYVTNTPVASGFYILQLSTSYSALPLQIFTMTFPTDRYTCPYSSEYEDRYQNFPGCMPNRNAITKGLPCIVYDEVTNECSSCLQGYSLVNSTCLASTTCPARQYYHFGSCYNVSEDCDNYDPFTGNCLTCRDILNYDLINGICIHVETSCGEKQWKSNNTCFNVSVNCNTFNPNTGFCLSCLGATQLNSEGLCLPIKVKCSSDQYLKDLQCVRIPSQCQQFNTDSALCLICNEGYKLRNGICEQVDCPPGQSLQKTSGLCVDISQLCATYDHSTGQCLSCKAANYAVREGKCYQYISPLAGCQERQMLGFGECPDAKANCKTFNLLSSDCEECFNGYYIDYRGLCTPNALCASNQYSLNGECLNYPENCLKVDKIGLCVQCADLNFNLANGQCILKKTCQSHQYLNPTGQCVDVNPSCAMWNPSNGQCITCKIIGTQPFSGVCCPIGQVFRKKSCVDVLVLATANVAQSDFCLIRHPSLNHCLKCAEGYVPDYDVSFGCSQR